MRTIVGIFAAHNAASRAVDRLRETGVAPERINILLPGGVDLGHTALSESEQPGVARALGAVVGGAAGAFAGLSVSALLFLPGVGAVAAIGAAAAATLGAAGALGGAAAGEALENALDNGLPVDEQYLYEDALRHGRIVITIEALDAGEAGALRSLLLEAGAESIDKAREHWWSSLKSAEQAEFDSGESADHEPAYRFGFEAAQSLRARRKSFDEALPYLRAYFPDLCHLEAFRRGYEDGRLRQEALQGHQ